MKFYLLFLVVLFSCEKKQEKSINYISVNYVSSGKKYGQLCKPSFYIIEKKIKNKDFTMLVYEDSISFKRVDTLKLYNNGKIIFNSIEAEKVDKKCIVNKNKVIYIEKIYIPRIGEISVDDYGGEIIYLTNEGILVRYSIASNYIFLYKPDIYSDLHFKILHRKFDFKRHNDELEGLP